MDLGSRSRPSVRFLSCEWLLTVELRWWTALNVKLLLIGVGIGFRRPLPPNRTGGFPAYGSPVGGFFIETVSPITRPCEARTARLPRRRHSGEVFRKLAEQRESRVEEGHLARVYGELKRGFIGQHFWARGYFVSTVGRDEKVIRDYIKNQEKEDQRLDQLNLWR